jgi:dTDP-4-dehydrorhamnose 3,5-epimerase
MKPISPKTMAGELGPAWEFAKANLEPVFVPAAVFTDDRGWSLMNQMQGVMGPQGQVNYSVQYPGVIKAWHRHALQTDFWICLQGHIKVGVHRESDAASWLLVIGEKRPGVMIIPPPLWHGAATVGPDPAGLLYYVTHAYNPQKPDEDRRGHDSIAGFPWGVRHG